MKISLKTDKETLLKLLKEGDFNKKLKIFNKLGELSESDRIKILLKILEDNSWYLREQATCELAKYGNKLVPRLKKLCSKGFWYTRAAACRTLGEIGDLEGMDAILNLLFNDTNPTVVKEAKGAIKKLAEINKNAFLQKLRENIDRMNPTCDFYSILSDAIPELAEKFIEIFSQVRKNGT
jgi:HEAT repeat protein|uniref:HEAT repeat domain-containing protein n=1 Tax=candidate division WOR-3 bacterium TaxID=2052148 RepID=A0A7V3VU66_UNCW3